MTRARAAWRGVLLGTLLLLPACEGDPLHSRLPAVDRVEVSPATAQIPARSSIQLQATTLDAAGRPLTARQVLWESSDTAVATVGSDGRVTGVRPGSVSISALSEGKRGAAEIVVTPGAPARLEKLAGDDQTGTAGAALPDSLTLRVVDLDGNPVPGTTVVWSVSDGGEVQPGSERTDAHGQARALWILGRSAGAQSATASVQGAAPVTFRATVLAPPTVATARATGITPTRATLNGSVDPHGSATQVWFEWGTSSTLASYDSTAAQPIGAGAGSRELSQALEALAPGETYYFRIAAANAAGVGRGEVLSFATGTPAAVRIVTFGDSNTDIGYQGTDPTPRVASYISRAPGYLAPSDPNSPLQLAGKVEARWRALWQNPVTAVNHAIAGTTTGGGVGGGYDRHYLGPPHARTAVNGVTRFEAEALGLGYPWHGGEPVNASYPEGPVTRVKAFVPGPTDFLYLSMGTNDPAEMATAQTLANLEWMVERWLAAGRRADHLLITTLPPNTSAAGGTLPAINDGIRAIAARHGVHLIDLASHTSADNGLSWRSEDLHVDGAHYSESVREWLATQIVDHMRRLVPVIAH